MPNFHRFLAAHACNTLSVGVQIVLLAWLAVGVLRLPAAAVGWVQASVLLPNVLVLIFAGRLVERANATTVLRMANGLLVLVHGVFWWAMQAALVDTSALIVYAVALGTANALVQNARETLLGRVGGEGQLQRNISAVTLVQFAAQALGVALGALLEWFTPASVIALQLGLCACALVFYSGAGLSAAGSKPEVASANASLRFAAHTVEQIKPLRAVLLLVAFNGFMHLGLFLVILPIMSTQLLGYTSFGYVTLQLTFIVGSAMISARLLFGRGIAHPGQHVLFAALYSGVIGLALAAGPKPSGLYLLVFCWGLVAGGSANLCRFIVHSLAPENLRARTMSLYQIALFGMAPLGALAAGHLVQQHGVSLALKVMAWASFAVFALALLQRELWAFKAPAGEMR